MSGKPTLLSSPEPKSQVEADMKELLNSTPENMQEIHEHLKGLEPQASPRLDTVEPTVSASAPESNPVEETPALPVERASGTASEMSNASNTSNKIVTKKQPKLPRVALLGQQSGEKSAKPREVKKPAQKRGRDEQSKSEEPKPKERKTLHKVPSRFMEAAGKAVAASRQLVAQRKKEVEESNKMNRGAVPKTKPTTVRSRTPPRAVQPPTKPKTKVAAKVNTNNHKKPKPQSTQPQRPSTTTSRKVSQLLNREDFVTVIQEMKATEPEPATTTVSMEVDTEPQQKESVMEVEQTAPVEETPTPTPAPTPSEVPITEPTPTKTEDTPMKTDTLCEEKPQASIITDTKPLVTTMEEAMLGSPIKHTLSSPKQFTTDTTAMLQSPLREPRVENKTELMASPAQIA